MDCAIITGADNPIGQAIARKIIDMGYRVYGLGQFKRGSAFEHRQFHPIGCDLTQPSKIGESLESIAEENQIVSLLIHASPLSTLPGKDSASLDGLEPGEVETLMRMQLLGPVLLSRLLLKPLTRTHGHIVFLSPAVDPATPANPALLAATAGLRRFANSLFDREREQGLRVTHLILDPNNSARQSLRSGEAQELLNPKQVALATEQILRTAAEGNVVTELVLRPQIPEGGNPLPKTGSFVDPYREILLPPSENFPREPEPLLIPSRPQPRQTITPEDIEKAGEPDPEPQRKSRRRNRRRNRGRRDHSPDSQPVGSGQSGEGSSDSRASSRDSRAAVKPPAETQRSPEAPKKESREVLERPSNSTDGLRKTKNSEDPPEKTESEETAPKKKSAAKRKAAKKKQKPDPNAAPEKPVKVSAKSSSAKKKRATPKKKSSAKKKTAAKKKAARPKKSD